MGLDMYMRCNSRTLTKTIHEKFDGTNRELFDFFAKRGIIGYWRKANAIHAWFVDHVQDGNDDCGQYTVTVPELLLLRETCKEVIANSKIITINEDCGDPRMKREVIADPTVAKRLLPTKGGFFFGSLEYDKWYLLDLEYTVELIDAIMDNLDNSESEFNDDFYVKGEPDWVVEFKYESSW